MKEITVPEYILTEVRRAISLAANVLESREKKTALDRQVLHAKNLLDWVIEGKIGNPPSYPI